MARWLSLATALAALLVLPLASAQAQPGTQPGKIIFPFAAGSGGDAVARLIAEKLRAVFRRPFVVDNRTGAAGRIGMQAAKASPADGSTLAYLQTGVARLGTRQPHRRHAQEWNPVVAADSRNIECSLGSLNG